MTISIKRILETASSFAQVENDVWSGIAKNESEDLIFVVDWHYDTSLDPDTDISHDDWYKNFKIRCYTDFDDKIVATDSDDINKLLKFECGEFKGIED